MSVDREFLEGLSKFSDLLNRKLPTLRIEDKESKQQPSRESLARVAPEWAKNIKTILFSEQMIAAKVKEMADIISAGRNVVSLAFISF
jgi:hypothetical protein